MSKKSEDTKGNSSADAGFVTTGGTVIEGSVVVGKDNKLTARQQALKSQGKLDENNQPIVDNKVAEAEKAANPQASAKAVESGLTDKEKATDAALVERRKVLEAAGEGIGGGRVIKAGAKLYQGWLTVSGKATTSGEEISVKYEQAEPVTEDGVFHAFRSYFPAALREGMKIDPENKDDPTKRTYLERPARAAA